MALSDYLQRVMTSRGWELQDLIAHTGLPRTTVWKLVNNPEQIPRLETLAVLSRQLNVSVSRLMAEIGYESVSDDPLAEQLATTLDMMPSIRPIAQELARLQPAELEGVLAYLRLLREQQGDR